MVSLADTAVLTTHPASMGLVHAVETEEASSGSSDQEPDNDAVSRCVNKDAVNGCVFILLSTLYLQGSNAVSKTSKPIIIRNKL